LEELKPFLSLVGIALILLVYYFIKGMRGAGTDDKDEDNAVDADFD
jgi:hypothetical protein